MADIPEFFRSNETTSDFHQRCMNLSTFDCSEEEMLWLMMGPRRLPLQKIVPISAMLVVIFLTGVVGNVARQLIDMCILPVLTHGAQTCSLTEAQKTKLGACQRAKLYRCLRTQTNRILRVFEKQEVDAIWPSRINVNDVFE
ncbi:Neuropeptide receptor A25 [Operophtera brumata]|uniref:Neuropeptide receptor A25 n=1 Tax=Operophtera brumata TaxID=104452 RepID=A0A0L7LNC6_OPEBR|nr:Neuropeptide receptor A25 [Operophtera brumata]